MAGVKSKLKGLVDTFGFKTDRRIVVIESDDWGSVRVPSAGALAAFAGEYPDWVPDQYQSNDCLDRYEDLKALGNVLESVANKSGKCPKMTLNFVMANPDFEAIEANGLSRFKYETIQASYRRQAEEDGLRARRAGADADASTGANADTGMGANADASAKTGTAKTAGESPAPQLGKTTLDALAEPAIARYFRPQLHGREHLNATLWLANARTDERQRRAFDLRMIGTDPGEYCAMDALNRTNTAVNRVDYLAEAAELFQQTFGYPSTSFIPSCYVWDDEVERVLSHLGITHIQSGRFRKTPRKDGSLGKKVQLMGGKTRGGQTLSIRNCNFEPARWAFEGATLDQCVARGLDEIEAAFAHNMPAVVCSHRVNYVGGVNPQNAQFGLEALGCMLGELAERHPDVEFLTSDQLGDLLREARR